MVCVVVDTGLPLSVTPLTCRTPENVGTITWSPSAPVAFDTLKIRMLLLHVMEPNDELLRPSTQVNSCLAEMIGTLRAFAAATIASDPADVATSVCMLAVKTP